TPAGPQNRIPGRRSSRSLVKAASCLATFARRLHRVPTSEDPEALDFQVLYRIRMPERFRNLVQHGLRTSMKHLLQPGNPAEARYQTWLLRERLLTRCPGQRI